MTMLPITLGNPEQESIFLCVYAVGQNQNLQNLGVSLGLKDLVHTDDFGRNYADLNSNTTLVLVDDNSADIGVLAACDGVIFVLDAATGVSAPAIGFWQELADLEIPRQILATNLFATHTDFDELVAISRRVFSEAILVRYLPMADDAESKVVALFDLLLNQIIDFTSGAPVLTSPDIEHIELTSDQRDLLFENLAYLGLSDEALEMYQAGITPPIQNFETAWTADSTVAITPLDELAGLDIIRTWISSLSNRWNPIIESDEHLTHTSTPQFYGLCIAQGLARIWGHSENTAEVTGKNGETEQVCDIRMFASCLLGSNVETGDVVHEPGQSLTLVAPSFD